MQKLPFLALFALCLSFSSQAQKAPISTVLVPVTVNLRPLYALAERSVDTLFTSEGYPDGWQQEECDVRYKYSFRRGPLQMSTNGNLFQLSFTGYYKITGSVRACVGGKAITGWTPPCHCGFEEGEIPVRVQFSSRFTLLTNYQLKIDLQVAEPVPQRKCEVCFWKQDITKKVMAGIKEELIAAKQEIDKSYARIDLSREMGKIWADLQTPYSLPGMGYLMLHPVEVNVNRFQTRNDTLFLLLGLKADPIVALEKDSTSSIALPPIKPSTSSPGFQIRINALLRYDSLTAVLQRTMQGQSFDLKKGIIRKKFIIDSLNLQDSYSGHCLLKVYFSGTDQGIAYLRARPWYDSISKEIRLEDADITIHANDKLLDLSDKLFQQKLKKEIANRARFPLRDYFILAEKQLNEQLNKEWIKGVQGKGSITEMKLEALNAGARYLQLSLRTKGELSVTITEASLSL